MADDLGPGRSPNGRRPAPSGRLGPLVVACLAPADLRPEVDHLTGTVTADPRRSDLSPADAAALEHALRCAQAWDGWVLAVAAGPPEIDPVLALAAAVGAEALRLDWRSPAAPAAEGPRPLHPSELAGDPAALAAALARVISGQGRPVAVFCGDRSPSNGTGSVPALLAHHLGTAQALGVVSLTPGPRGTISAERRLDRGWRERLVITGPCVLSVEAAGVRLRRAGLDATLAAGSSPVAVVTPGRAGPETGKGAPRYGTPRPYRPRPRPVPAPTGSARERVLEITGALTQREPPRIVGPLGAAEAADELLAYLRRNGVEVPPPPDT